MKLTLCINNSNSARAQGYNFIFLDCNKGIKSLRKHKIYKSTQISMTFWKNGKVMAMIDFFFYKVL